MSENTIIISLEEALNDSLYSSHQIGDEYKMDGKGSWKIAYYPLFEDGKTGDVYNEPRALVETETMFDNVIGTDFREVPLRYLERHSK